MANVLAAVFLLGFAVQRLVELLDPFVEQLAGRLFPGKPKAKEWTAGLLSLAIGLVLAWFGGVRLLRVAWAEASPFVDVLVSAVVLSAGTEAVNTVMKYLGYLKADAKQRAIASKPAEPVDPSA